MSNIGPGHGFSNPAGRFQAAQSSGAFKPQETGKKEKAGNAGASAPAAPSANRDGITFNNLLGTADVAPPPSFGEITQSVVSNIAGRDPGEALDELKNPELKQWLQLGILPNLA